MRLEFEGKLLLCLSRDSSGKGRFSLLPGQEDAFIERGY